MAADFALTGGEKSRFTASMTAKGDPAFDPPNDAFCFGGRAGTQVDTAQVVCGELFDGLRTQSGVAYPRAC